LRLPAIPKPTRTKFAWILSFDVCIKNPAPYDEPTLIFEFRRMSPLQTEIRFVGQRKIAETQLRVIPIDTAFPEEEANKLAHLESFNKHLFRPNTYLHKWWARRSGTTFRFILKQLIPDAGRRNYYASGGLEGITVLDPMMGGGTTMHEAIRLGANAIGYDLDPIPVLQVRASLAQIPLEEKEQVFGVFLHGLEKELKPLFQTGCPECNGLGEIQFILYAARKSCACGEALVVDSFRLREETDGCHKDLKHYYPTGTVKRGGKEWRLYEKDEACCSACSKKLGSFTGTPFAERYVPLITVGNCGVHGQFFKAVDENDLSVIEQSRKIAAKARFPETESLQIDRGPKSGDLLNRNIQFYSELFTPRQLLYISAAKRLLDAADFKHRIWLSLLVSTSLEFNSALCGYKGADKRRPGAVRHVFSHHAYSIPHTSLESNPVFSKKTSGTLRRLFDDRVRDASEWANAPVERQMTTAGWRKIVVVGETDNGQECSSVEEFNGQGRQYMAEQRDSSRMSLADESVDFVVTDPPYFDSVQYSDLSQFFRVWLKWFIPNEADWHFTPTSSAVAENGENAAKYRTVLGSIFRESNRVLRRPHGRLVFTFHHWRADAWTQLTLALKDAGFRLVNTYTVHSENPISVHIRKLKSLKHDSILVLQPSELVAEQKPFVPVGTIDMSDSFQFCRDCAELLGFCLEKDLEASEIVGIWASALGQTA
jgi:putative DNA methylase